jgi:hypothetical protein
MTPTKWIVLAIAALVILILGFMMYHRLRRAGGVVAVHSDSEIKS